MTAAGSAPRPRRSALERLNRNPELPDGMSAAMGCSGVIGGLSLLLAVLLSVVLAIEFHRAGSFSAGGDGGLLGFLFGLGMNVVLAAALIYGVRRRARWAWAVAVVHLGLWFLFCAIFGMVSIGANLAGGALFFLGIALVLGLIFGALISGKTRYENYCKAGRTSKGRAGS